jgi:ubiquitin-protein ligase
MSQVRLRRLQADFARLQDYVRRHPRVQLVQYDGNPPERYQLKYRIRSLRQRDDELVEVSDHLVEIFLPLNYPRTPPQCRMLTPIFHPNIAPHAICIGDHWSPGEALQSIVTRIGEMIAYQSYNTKSPLNGEAARWVDQNLDRLPLDSVSMDAEELPAVGPAGRQAPPPSRVVPPAPPPLPVAMPVPQNLEITCPGCSTRLLVPSTLLGRQARCPHCRTVITVPTRVPPS